jgi:ParB family chromosome partitioning protein
MSALEKRQPLGRGLNALFGDEPKKDVNLAHAVQTVPQHQDTIGTQTRGFRNIAVGLISPSPYQPRKVFSDESLNELASSLKQHGMAQPMVVRPKPNTPGQYELIAGERRWRAAQRVPMHVVPVIIQDIDDKTAMEIALIENLQRVDLNPLEEARAFQRLIDEYNYKQDQLATVLGKSRSHISNLLRLLQLPESVQDRLLDGTLTMGHARALITATNPEALAVLIVKNGLSVREAEKLAAKQKDHGGTPEKIAKAVQNATHKVAKDADIRALESNLSQLLGLRVAIEPESLTKGVLTIAYQSLDQLDDVLRRLSK